MTNDNIPFSKEKIDITHAKPILLTVLAKKVLREFKKVKDY